MRLWKMLIFIFCAPVFAVPTPPLPPGMPDGGCWSDPENVLTAKINTGAFSSNTVGGTLSVRYNGPAYANTWCYSESGNHTAVFSSMRTDLSQTGSNNLLKLTDDVDIKIYVDTFNYPFFVPTENSQQGPAQIGQPGPSGNGITVMTNGSAGGSGIVTFILKRNIVGGGLIIPPGIELLRFYRYVYSEKTSTKPIFRLVTPAMIMPLPAVCKINDGQTISVPFGNIDSSLLTNDIASSPYFREKKLKYNCNTTVAQDMKVTLFATPAGYADAIQTTNTNLGVVMTHNGRSVPPMGSFSTKVVNRQGEDDVKFIVVKNPAVEPKDITTGEFKSNNTVLLISTL